MLAAMGGPDEARIDGLAESWSAEVPAFNTLAVECVAGPERARFWRGCRGCRTTPFRHDGQMTKPRSGP